MRDLARIEIILGNLRRYWYKHPDLRLAQIVVNAANTTAPEVFYMEDHILNAYLAAKDA